MARITINISRARFLRNCEALIEPTINDLTRENFLSGRIDRWFLEEII